MIKIDLENTYLPVTANPDLMTYTFMSPQKDGTDALLKVKIRNINDPLLPEVYNLGFGPPIGEDGIDDKISLAHLDKGIVFSTIILFAIAFLQNNPGTTIGIDGSDERRAYLYHRMFQSNYESLKDVLVITGVDYYVRLLRNGHVKLDNQGAPFYMPIPEPFDLQRKTTDLYRYYMINLTE